MKAKDLMTREVVSVDKDERLIAVLELMKKGRASKFPVTEDGKLVGLVVDGDVADELGAVKNRGVSVAQLHVTTAMRRNVPTVGPDTEREELVRRMLEHDLGMLPVVVDRAVLGVVTASDLLRGLDDETPVRDVMTDRLFMVSPSDRVIHARRLMLDNHVERLPVQDGGKIVGIVGERDIALGLWDFRDKVPLGWQGNQLKEFLVLHVMHPQVVTIEPSATAREAANRMRENDVGSLPVTQGDRIVGILTRSDLLRLEQRRADRHG